ncbi:alpha/beta hydrolase [Streptomyces nigrescens]|uniref:alpha/beta hydrolase n=1 Tax=Streptomyces nigrescens TaxID=1920 RepID=UPI0021C2B4F9|nr:alpha/beta hydrolase [Streptomyces nigrescens]
MTSPGPGHRARRIRRPRTATAVLGCCTALAVTAGCGSSDGAGAGGADATQASHGATPTGQAAHAEHYTGELADGAQWIADVPQDFNGTLMLFSHGFGPLQARNAPDPKTRDALLKRGYALIGSSYSGSSLWALNVAVKDQFDTLSAVRKKVGAVREPKRTLAWGESMGGLINALVAQRGRGRVDGALSACGILAGGIGFNEYQTDGDYAINQLLVSGSSGSSGGTGKQIKVSGFSSDEEATASGKALADAVRRAQSTVRGRARTALVAALRNQPNWSSGRQPPTVHDYEAREEQQAEGLVRMSLPFTLGARYQVEKAQGGPLYSNVGVDYARLLRHSRDLPQVRALYKKAGLDLDQDLAKLTRNAHTEADPDAVRNMERTAVPSGHLAVPNLTLHTTDDPLNPAPQESEYARTVRSAGDGSMLRQTYVHATGHCTFRPGNWLAALNALEHRLDSGSWGSATEPQKLNQAAKEAGEGNYPAFLRYTAPELVGVRGRETKAHDTRAHDTRAH